jgi:transposase-like protein
VGVVNEPGWGQTLPQAIALDVDVPGGPNGLMPGAHATNGVSNVIGSCRFCKSDDTVKYGIRKNKGSYKQMFKCKRCMKRFTPDNGFLKMKTEPTIVSEALELYARGLSLAKIQDHLFQRHTVKISKEGIRGWITKYAAR